MNKHFSINDLGRYLGHANKLAGRLLLLACLLSARAATAQTLVNALEIPGDTKDLHSGTGANQNRFGGCSDLCYDREHDVWYGLMDRGPGGGVLPYETRMQRFKLDVDPGTGAISNFRLLDTIGFVNEDGSQPLDGLNPKLLANDVTQAGRSFDPEGLVVLGGDQVAVSDEYGPSVAIFRLEKKDGREVAVLVSRFNTPSRFLPRTDADSIDLLATKESSPPVLTGRAPNRGFEGLAAVPGSDRFFAVLQSPMADEGPEADGERGRFVRIAEFSKGTLDGKRDLIYELETVKEINKRIANEEGHFKKKKQGKAVGISTWWRSTIISSWCWSETTAALALIIRRIRILSSNIWAANAFI